MKNRKIAFVVGHSFLEQGAFSQTLQKSEFDFWKNISKKLTHIGDVFEHGNWSSYTKRQTETAKKTVDYDVVFELHFNSSSNKDANGCEALYWHKNTHGKYIAKKFCELLNSKMGIKMRGDAGAVAVTEKTTRGLAFFQKTKGTSILLEPFFGSNKEDCLKFDEILFIETLQELVEDINKPF